MLKYARRNVLYLLAAFILMGPLASRVRAYDVLWGDQQLTVDNRSFPILWLYDQSRAVIVSGGSVYYLSVHNNSAVDMSGGSISKLYAYDNSAVNISGGSISEIYAHYGSVVIFSAQKFKIDGGLSLDGDRLLGTDILSGEWFDGTQWTTSVTRNDCVTMQGPLSGLFLNRLH